MFACDIYNLQSYEDSDLNDAYLESVAVSRIIS